MPAPTSLIVVRAFGQLWPGDVITDPGQIAAILAGPNANKVRDGSGEIIVPPPDPPPPTTGAVTSVSGAFSLAGGALGANFGTGPGTIAQGNDSRFNAIGQPGAAGASVVYRGPWQASTAYVALNLVTFGGRLYIISTPHTSSGVFNPASWTVASEKGTDATGLPGVSILGGSINVSNHLILSLSNGSTFDAGVMPSSIYTLPPASASRLGGVKSGTNITIAGDGTISAADATLARTPHAPITAAGAITAADTDSLIVIPASVTGACPIALSSTFTGPLTVDNRSATAARITATGKTIAGDPYLDLYTGVTTLIAGGNDITASG